MSPGKRRHRHLLVPALGFSPFLRSLSRIPSAVAPPPTPSDLVDFSASASSPSLLKPHKRSRDQHHGVNPPESSDEEEESGDGSEEEGPGEEIVQVDFGFFDPKPSDFHGVKLLLQGYLDDKVWDLSGFVDLLLKQTTVGTVVKSDDGEAGKENVDEKEGGKDDEEDDLYAVISALNLGRYENHQCIKDVKDYVFSMCEDEALRKKLGLLLGERARDVGLLVCERFINYPGEAVPPLYNGLFDEIEWATEDEPTQELRDSFHIKFYLIITKIYVEKHGIQSKSKGKPSSTQNSDKHKTPNCQSNESIVYIKDEDEIFHKMSLFSFTFNLHSGQLVPPEMKNYQKVGLVMVVESGKVPAFRKELEVN